MRGAAHVLVAGVLATLGSACGIEADLPPRPTVRVDPITDGIPDAGHPSVGELLVPGTEPGKTGRCTATLAGTRWVLTAAHCLRPPGNFELAGRYYPVAKMIPHPGFDAASTKIPPDNDIGLALLDRPCTIEPVPTSIWAPEVGLTVVLVGFGITSDSAVYDGIKRTATNKVNEVISTLFSITGTGGGIGNLCKGDSGGPAFATLHGQEVQVGVTSAYTGAACGSTTWLTRVDAYRSWIETTTGGEVLVPDTQPPSISISWPEDGAVVPTSLTLLASVTDDRKLASVDLLVDEQPTAARAEPPFSFALSLSTGEHLLTLTAKDLSGNQSSQRLKVTAVQDAPPPRPPDPPRDIPGCQLAGAAAAIESHLATGFLLLAALIRACRGCSRYRRSGRSGTWCSSRTRSRRPSSR